jgi:hypothetical protein
MDDIRERLKHDAQADWLTLPCALCGELFIEDERPISTFKSGIAGHIECILTMDWPEQLHEPIPPIPESERLRARRVPWGRPFPKPIDEEDD